MFKKSANITSFQDLKSFPRNMFMQILFFNFFFGVFFYAVFEWIYLSKK